MESHEEAVINLTRVVTIAKQSRWYSLVVVVPAQTSRWADFPLIGVTSGRTLTRGCVLAKMVLRDRERSPEEGLGVHLLRNGFVRAEAGVNSEFSMGCSCNKSQRLAESGGGTVCLETSSKGGNLHTHQGLSSKKQKDAFSRSY